MMKHSLLLLFVVAQLNLGSWHGAAGQLVFEIDSSLSTLDVEVCVQGSCDRDAQNVGGRILLAVDDPADPSRLSVRNFDVAALDAYNFQISYGILGSIRAQVSDLSVRHAAPGPRQSWADVTGGTFSSSNVTYLTEGTADYTVPTLICSLLGDVPCEGVNDLSEVGVNTFDTVSGIYEVVGDRVHLFIDFSFSIPIDPNDPGLGTIAGFALIEASAALPEAPLISLGSVWRFLDDGSDQGVAWRENAFADAGWSQGQSELGYGDDDERTLVGFGADPADKFITTYFRKRFQVNDPLSYSELFLQLSRDDGAVVYLNGAEVFRSNMGEGDVLFSTLASSSVGGLDEAWPVVAELDPSLLINGENVVAVEVHQSSASSSDISFEMELAGALNNLPPSVTLIAPANGAEIFGNELLLDVDVSDFDGVVRRVDFYDGETLVGTTTSEPFTYLWTGVSPGDYSITAHAMDNAGQISVSPVAAVSFVKAPVTLIAQGSGWFYLDDGSDQGVAWREPLFNDSGWAFGAAELGYGDDDEATVVGFGGDEGNKFVTTYFRRATTVFDASIVTNLVMRLKRDDGAIVYLNGTEVVRSNMPEGDVGFQTFAAATAPDEGSFQEFILDPTVLVDGINVLAAEVHQAGAASSDLSFDLELLAIEGEFIPELLWARSGNVLLIRWPSAAAGYALYSTTEIADPDSWLPVTAPSNDNGVLVTVRQFIQPGNRYYRLQKQ